MPIPRFKLLDRVLVFAVVALYTAPTYIDAVLQPRNPRHKRRA